jgi:hypothetical protein
MSVLDRRTSSANGAFGRQPRHDSAGMRLVTAAPRWRSIQRRSAAAVVRQAGQPKVIFNVEPWRIGNGYYVTVTMPDSARVRFTETLATEGEAWRWIKNEGDFWLHSHKQIGAN